MRKLLLKNCLARLKIFFEPTSQVPIRFAALIPHLQRLAVLIDTLLHFQDLTSLIPLFYDHVELAEDRSLKIPSISDDEEIQLDPKRDTAMSGQFGMGVSSQSECYSGTIKHNIAING